MGKTSGKTDINGISLIKLQQMFPDDDTARKWFEDQIWGDKRKCPRCGCDDTSSTNSGQLMPYYCHGCHKRFSVRIGTVLEASKMSYQKWAIATYQILTNAKGISSRKLAKDLEITQKSAWFVLHRLRKSLESLVGKDKMKGPVEVDETYIGGLEKNKHADKKRKSKKTIVVGIKDRSTGEIRTRIVPEATAARLTQFIEENVEQGAKIYTDENRAYNNLENHETVNHSKGEYGRGPVHINGIESFWSLVDRGIMGTYHVVSPKHLWRYLVEFSVRLKLKEKDTRTMMESVVKGMVGIKLTYSMLTA